MAAAVPGDGCGCASRCWLLAVRCWLCAVGCWLRLCQVIAAAVTGCAAMLLAVRARRHVTTPAHAQLSLSPGTRAPSRDSSFSLLPKLLRGGGACSTAARPGGICGSPAEEASRRALPPSAAAAGCNPVAGRTARGARGRPRARAGTWHSEFPTFLFLLYGLGRARPP